MQVNESIVRAVKAPESTETWCPFPHAHLLDELEFVREISGLKVANTRYELSENKQKFFGVWTFEEWDCRDNLHSSIGFRNSIDKSLSVGLTAGSYVVVCSNMAFSGEWMHFRKHTKFITEDLRIFLFEAFGVCIRRARREALWLDNLSSIPLSDQKWKVLTYDALDQGILPITKSLELFNPMLERNLGVWFNVVTNVLSQRSLLNTETQFTNLRQLVAPYAS